MHAPQTNEPRPPGAARQSSRPCDAPPRNPPCPRERNQPNKQKGGKERPQHAQQRGHIPPRMQNHQHPCQPGRNDRAKPSCGSPRAKATATPHILPYIGRVMVKTTNPKHTPPTKNHPADKQTPPQHKAEKPDATAEPSDARPAIQNMEARAVTHRTTTPTPQHAKQRRTEHSNEHPKQKPCTKPTPCKCAPTSPPKTKAPAKVHPHEKKTYSIQVQEHGRPLYPCLK
ncbi:extensin-like [Girardinichthys multiradiatus]|uniref:extensin-like n=1 Tax=Girardinichthys multiradiatus TaxID=208333 RepID=UPI001FAC84C8|nr:extensin-like [Girardinichthys multiradiatus]